MLKWYAETFKLSDRELTSVALQRIEGLTILSLPAVPLVMTNVYVDIPHMFAVPFIVILAVSVISFFCLCFTKFVNRFWARDRYLDEWEKARKHQAMAFAFQVMCYSLGAVMLFSILSDAFSIFENVVVQNLGTHEIGIVAVGLMIFGLYVMHLYLLFTVKPIDVGDENDDALEVAN